MTDCYDDLTPKEVLDIYISKINWSMIDRERKIQDLETLLNTERKENDKLHIECGKLKSKMKLFKFLLGMCVFAFSLLLFWSFI